MLPAEITTESIRQTSDDVDAEGSGFLDAIDDAEVMNQYIDEVAQRIIAKHNLTDEQADELINRICWRLELLPE